MSEHRQAAELGSGRVRLGGCAVLSFRVLGPVEVLDGNRVVEISGQRQRRLLCSLIAAGGMVVSSDRLAEQLWDDDDRPPGAVRAVRTYVARLRKSLGDGGSAIVTSPHGYVLSMDGHRFDVADLERLVELARSSANDDHETAVGLLSESAALWRGDPYGEFGDLEWLRTEVQRLSELQRGVIEDLFDARLVGEFGAGLVGDIERAIGSYPLSERLRGQQMEALWRLGRDADAIRAFQAYRQFLGEETGLEPSTGLKELENDIITGTVTAPNKQTPRRQQSRPTGTVTFLFTDVEGSTRRWEDDAAGMSAALAEHDAVLRGAIEGHGGYVFSSAGDAFAAAFADPVEAVAAAVEAQRGLALPVRMGVHAGTADEREGHYFGPTLNRAARVMGAAHGGQVLLSAATSKLMRGVVDLQDLGEHRLRDLSGVEHLFQVRGEGLASEFARLRTVDNVPGNLPAHSTSFVGRDVEVNELAEVVSQHRLVTLTGVGGVGKTRLAVQVAAELMPEFGDGVWLVELAPVGDPGAVPDAVATALGVTAQAGRSVTAGIAEALAGRRLLVVLDNCEHVVDAAADLIEAILAGSPTVSIITTSREGLRVDGEHLWPVPSLDVAEGARSAAVELFTERARAIVPGFSLDDDADVEAVIEICRRLDGIALAIELAAARMVSMTPIEVLARLNDRFRLLSGSRRGLERHQTLRQAVQWSYDLLTGDEQAVLGTCAVFAAGFDATAVTAVCERFDELKRPGFADCSGYWVTASSAGVV